MSKRLVCAGAFLVAGCLSDQEALKLDAEKAVKAMLKDPASAQFSGLYVVFEPPDDGVRRVAVCGYVNARNSYGGYTGKQRFVASGHIGKVASSTLLDVGHAQIEGPERFATVESAKTSEPETVFEKVYWNRSCVDAAHPPTFSGENSRDP